MAFEPQPLPLSQPAQLPPPLIHSGQLRHRRRLPLPSAPKQGLQGTRRSRVPAFLILPTPVEEAYSWGAQSRDRSLADSPCLRRSSRAVSSFLALSCPAWAGPAFLFLDSLLSTWIPDVLHSLTLAPTYLLIPACHGTHHVTK